MLNVHRHACAMTQKFAFKADDAMTDRFSVHNIMRVRYIKNNLNNEHLFWPREEVVMRNAHRVALGNMSRIIVCVGINYYYILMRSSSNDADMRRGDRATSG